MKTRVLLTLITMLIFTSAAFCATRTFQTAGNWSASGNWLGSAMPIAGDDVVIAANCTVDQVIPNVITITINSGITLNMQTNTWPSTATPSNSGIIRTQASTLPSGKTWGGRIILEKTSGTQTLSSGTYYIVEIGTTATTTMVAGGELTINSEFIIPDSKNFSMQTYRLLGSFSPTFGSGALFRTNSTSTTSLPANKTWGGTVEYIGGGQTVPAGTFATLTMSGSGTKSMSGDVTVSTLLDLNSSTLSIGAHLLTINGDILESSGTLTGGTSSSLAIGGSGTFSVLLPTLTLSNLTLDRASGLELTGNLRVNGTLTMTSGVLAVAASNLTLGTAAVISGTPSASKMIAVDYSGELRKEFSSAGSFTFPVGDYNGTPDYSPVTLSFSAGTFGSSAFAAVFLSNTKHPQNASASNYLTRYWTLSQSNITGYTCTATFTYADADINGTESSIWTGQYSGTSWTRRSQANTGTNQLSASGITSLGDFTGGSSDAMQAKLFVNTKVYLQGPWSSSSSSMVAYLIDPSDSSFTFLPRTQPYSGTPWSYSGTENVRGKIFYASNTSIIDWVLVELRSTASGAPVERRAGFVKSDGSIVDVDGSSLLAFSGASSGNYFIVVNQRNHLSIMSASAQALNLSSALYNFTTAQTQAYNQGSNPMTQIGTGVYGMISGDGNGDGAVDSFDNNNVWGPNNSFIGYYGSDYNLDSSTDSVDSNLFWNPNNGAFSQVP